MESDFIRRYDTVGQDFLERGVSRRRCQSRKGLAAEGQKQIPINVASTVAEPILTEVDWPFCTPGMSMDDAARVEVSKATPARIVPASLSISQRPFPAVNGSMTNR